MNQNYGAGEAGCEDWGLRMEAGVPNPQFRTAGLHARWLPASSAATRFPSRTVRPPSLVGPSPRGRPSALPYESRVSLLHYPSLASILPRPSSIPRTWSSPIPRDSSLTPGPCVC
jgi:hypothetical protein